MSIVSFLFLIAFMYVVTSTVRYFFMLSRWDGGATENPFGFGDFTAPKVETRKVTKVPHPEMVDVKPGEELMVVKFGKPEPTDPLLKSLNKRVDELKDVWEDDDDDEGDGDIPARLMPK